MRILVIGGSGLVGGHVLREAVARGFLAVGTSRSAAPGFRPLDASSQADAERLIDEVGPTAVVHAAGFTWADGCERDPGRSFAENVLQAESIARLCARKGAAFAHLSSSYVFSGEDGPYDEEARPAPVNVYGRHKMEAEARVLAASSGAALVLRLIHVWGVEARMKNFAYQVRRANLAGQELAASQAHSGNPTWAGDIANWTVDLLQGRRSGIWHLAGENPDTTRWEWAHLIMEGLHALGQPRLARLVQAAPAGGIVAPRPPRAGLLTGKIQAAFPRRTRQPADLPPEFA